MRTESEGHRQAVEVIFELRDDHLKEVLENRKTSVVKKETAKGTVHLKSFILVDYKEAEQEPLGSGREQTQAAVNKLPPQSPKPSTQAVVNKLPPKPPKIASNQQPINSQPFYHDLCKRPELPPPARSPSRSRPASAPKTHKTFFDKHPEFVVRQYRRIIDSGSRSPSQTSRSAKPPPPDTQEKGVEACGYCHVIETGQ